MATKIVTCVSYHHFERTPSPFTRYLHVSTSAEAFARQLAYYKRHYSPISLDQLLGGNLPDNPLLLTIDDAYRSVLDIAAPLLREQRVPALLMTNGRVIAGNYAPIDNVLSLALSELGFMGTGIAAGLADPWNCTMPRLVREVLPRLDGEQRNELKRRLLKLLAIREPELVARMSLFLDPSDLKRLIAEYPVTVGNHTASHMHLRALAPEAVQREIEDGKRAIEQMVGTTANAFSFPYGSRLDATPLALDLVRRTGHKAIFLVQRRTNAVRPAPDIWYRQGMAEEMGLHLPVKLTWLPRMGELKAALN